MGQDIKSEKALRQYLLGELSPDEQKQLEERLLADNDYFQQLLVAEDDLVDDYVSGELPSPERKKFDNYFLAAPQRQQDLRFAQALRKYVSTSTVAKAAAKVDDSPQKVSWLNSLWASLRPQIPLLGFSLAAILVLVVGGLWLLKRQSQQQSTPGVARTQPTPVPTAPPPVVNTQPTNNTQPGIEQPTNNSNQSLPVVPTERRTPELASKTQKQTPSVFPVALVSGITRSEGETKRVEIPRGTRSVQLRLELDPGADDYQSYQAVLQTGAGRDILNKSGLRARATSAGKIVIWMIPANIFKSEDYFLKLSGRNPDGQPESAGTYSFRVIEK